MNDAGRAAHLVGSVGSSRALRTVIVVSVLLFVAGWVGMVVAPAAFIASVTSGEQINAAQVGSSDSCQVTLGDAETAVTAPNLSGHQVGAAHTIWQVAHQVGVGDQGAVVGIATAMQESTLDANLSTRQVNGDGDVALFQQRAKVGWYADGLTVEENVRILSDHAYAARTFFEGHVVSAQAHAAASSPAGPVGYRIPGLKQVAGWEGMQVTQAAQAVQRSAFPGYYAKWEPMARQLVAGFNAEGPPPAGGVVNPALCAPPGSVDAADCPDSRLAVERGLTPDAVRVVRCVKKQFPSVATIYGVRPDSLPEHPSGRAVDIMLPGRCDPLGDQIAAWAKDNAPRMGVTQVIWCQRIWTTQRAGEGWRGMGDRGSATENHMDHVHVTVAGNAAATPVAAAGGGGGTVSPVDSYVLTARFGQCSGLWAACHTGLDFAAGGRPAVKAVRAGTVTSTAWNSAYGNLTKVDHGGGLETWYAHQSSQAVRAGDRVQAGQEIGRMGQTGNTTGDHLHLEVRLGGSPVDPDRWLSSNGVTVRGGRG